MARKKSKKTARRGRGEGAVYLRNDGRWVGSINVEATDGKRKRKYFYGGTKQEAQDKVNTALYTQKQGMLATGPQQTLKKYFEHWLENVHKHHIRISTYNKYRYTLRKHIIPALGHIQLQKLTSAHIEAFYSRKIEEGLAPETINGFHGLLHNALSHAMVQNLVSKNVCDAVSPPRIIKHEVTPLTVDQSRTLLLHAKGHRILEAMLALTLTSGMRRGELLGLKWQDVDLTEGSLQIRRTVGRIGTFGLKESEPKTPSSRRKITLPHFVIKALKQHEERQDEERLQAGASWRDLDLVFTNTHGGYIEPAHLNVWFTNLLKEAGLPHIRFHDLRHGVATFLLAIGVPAKVVQELLGHSQISMTMDTYSHVLPSMQRDAMDKLNVLFGNEGEEKGKK